jgi:hypothetical protein
MFQAARAALAAVGIHRRWWCPGSLQAIFSTELEQRRKLYPAAFVRNLAEAMELRHSADYNGSPVSPRRATRVVRTATEVVSQVQEVIRNV